MYENVFVGVTNLTKPFRINTGGLCSITFFLWEDVAVWPVENPLTGIIEAQVQLKAGKSFYSIAATEKERSFQEEMKVSAAGPYFEMQITPHLAGNTVANTLSLGNLKYHQVGLIVKDRNGESRLIGNEDSGTRLVYDYKSADINSSRGRQLVWKWESENSAPIYGLAGTVEPRIAYGFLREDGGFILREDGGYLLRE